MNKKINLLLEFYEKDYHFAVYNNFVTYRTIHYSDLGPSKNTKIKNSVEFELEYFNNGFYKYKSIAGYFNGRMPAS